VASALHLAPETLIVGDDIAEIADLWAIHPYTLGHSPVAVVVRIVATVE
jgi:hypothetical protein